MHILSTFGRLPGTWVNLFVIVLSGLAEGFGLILFVPLLELMAGSSTAGLEWPFTILGDVFAVLGIPVTVMTNLAAIVVLILGSLGLAYLQRLLLFRAKHFYNAALRETFAEVLFGASWAHMAKQSHGEIVNQFIVESRRAAAALEYELYAVALGVQVAIYFAFSMTVAWQLVVITLGFVVLTALLVWPLQRRARTLGELTNAANRDFSFFGLDFLKSFKLVKVTASEPSVTERLSRHIRALCRVTLDSDVNAIQIYYLVQALPVLLLAGILAAAHTVLELGTSFTLVFLLILARLAPRVAQLAQQVQSFNVNAPGIEVMDAMIDACRTAREDIGDGRVPFRRLNDGIAVEGVNYHYGDGAGPALESVDLTIRRNQMVALVGSSGAGKSTLIDLLAGLRVPESGRIVVDGVDLAEIDLASWRRRIGYVAQDAIIFNDTLRNNVLFGHPEAAENLDECLRIAHLEEFVSTLPGGLDTVLGESGVRLSGGQKQRLALARALVGKPELLLLDEPMSALDSESERLIQDALEAITHNVTVVVVAHRLSTVRKADTIAVLERGRIVETGTFATLMARDGRFSELHDIQFA